MDTTLQAANTVNGIYTINYQAASSGQVLTAGWTALSLSNALATLLPGRFLVINASVTNQAPVVSAGADQSISLPAAATLSGTASDDGLPAPPSLVTTWSKVSGPGTVTFANPSAPGTTATFTTVGSYVLRLTATDGTLFGSDDIAVTVQNSNQTPTITNPGDQVNAEGNAANLQVIANDPDGDTLTYSATGLPGGLAINSSTGQITGSLSFTSAGSHSVTVTVNDGRNGTASTNFIWAVSNTNQFPAVSLTSPVNGAVFTAPANININANAGDSDGSVNTVEFYANGALIGADQTAPYGITWSGVAAGSYSLTAIVTDDAGAATTSNAITMTVSVSSSGLLSAAPWRSSHRRR
ncbi:MAG: Ig-like domain-containing protein [Pyrinomonadaceae bacterium]